MIPLEEALSQTKYKKKSKINEELVQRLCKKYDFVKKDIKYLKENFVKMAPQRILDLNLWKNTLGIMNVPKAEFLAKQIFKAIDRDKDGLAFFEDYVHFTHILILGTIGQKAKYSFKLLDTDNKGYIEEKDVYNMMSSIFELWNILTNSKVVVLPEYVQTVFKHLDRDNDKKIVLEEYLKLYENEEIVFGWFEYLNQEELFLSEIREQKVTRDDKEEQLNYLKKEIGNCIKMLVDLEEARTPLTRSRSISAMGSRSTSPFPRNSGGLTKNHSIGKIHSEIVNSIVSYGTDANKGFSGPKSLDCSEEQYLPPGDSIPPYFSDDFNFNVLSPFENQPSLINKLKEAFSSPDTKNSSSSMSTSQLTDQLKHHIIKVGVNVQQLNDKRKEKVRQFERNTSIAEAFDSDQPKIKKSSKGNIKLFFGHENWNLMMNMLIGFRAGIKMLLYKEILVDSDFTHVVRHDINNVTFTSVFERNHTFILYEYAPYVFSKIRAMIGFSEKDYLRSLGPENILGNLMLGNLNSMSQLASEGKSGSLFYLTHDNKFFVKTIDKDEHRSAFAFLKQYYEYLKRNPNTLLCKVTSLYKIETFMQGKFRTLYVCVMKNIFSDISPDNIYDLKGSTVGRTSRKGDTQKGSVAKDLDWINDGRCLKIDRGLQSYLSQILESDSSFLSKLGVMDYSLLVGIHDIKGDLDNPEVYLETMTRDIERNGIYRNGVKIPIHKVRNRIKMICFDHCLSI